MSLLPVAVWAPLAGLWNLAPAIFLLSFLVVLHELGHFLVAKRLGVPVDRFSLSFGPRVVGLRCAQGRKSGACHRLPVRPPWPCPKHP